MDSLFLPGYICLKRVLIFASVTAYWKGVLSFLWTGFIVVFLSFIQSEGSIYGPSSLKFILWILWYDKWTQSNMKSLLLVDVSNSIGYLDRNDLKKFFYIFNCFNINHDFYVISF